MKLHQLKREREELHEMPPPWFSQAQRMSTGGTSQPHFSFSRLRLEMYKGDRNKMGRKKCEDCEKWAEEMYWTKFKEVHFFAVLTKNFRFQLRFPDKLVKKCLVNELAEINVVTLKGPSGKPWTVELMRIGSDDYEELYLKKGWEVFVKEHSLKENDFLLFKYNVGSSVFDVLMFDEANFCEKGRSGSVRMRDCKNESFDKSCNEGLKERKRVERESWLDVKGSHKSKGLLNERNRVAKEPSLEIIEPKRVLYQKRVITISDDDEEDQRYGRVIVRPRLAYPLPGCKGKALVTVKSEEESEDDEVAQVKPLRILETKSKKDSCGTFEQAIQECKRMKMPHFAVRMKRTHLSTICFMTVPIKTANKYIAYGTEFVFLKMNGKTWVAEYKCIKEGVNSGLRGSGWIDFVDENDIKVGDGCLFKITSKKPVTFEVCIFRDEDVLWKATSHDEVMGRS